MGLGKTSAKGIFCLEGHWESDLRDLTSVEPALRLLREAIDVPSIHRRVGTRPEFEFYLAKWVQKKYRKHPILYLAFHGDPNVIWTPESRQHGNQVKLDDLAALLEGRCEGRIIHLGTCSTLHTHGAHLNRFLHRTQALAVCGYTTYVDWVTATAFDLILFNKMQVRAFNRQGAELIYRDIKSEASGLVHRLGFRMKVRPE